MFESQAGQALKSNPLPNQGLHLSHCSLPWELRAAVQNGSVAVNACGSLDLNVRCRRCAGRPSPDAHPGGEWDQAEALSACPVLALQGWSFRVRGDFVKCPKAP